MSSHDKATRQIQMVGHCVGQLARSLQQVSIILKGTMLDNKRKGHN